MIVYYVFLFVALAVVFISNNESWVRKFNIKFGFIPESNIFATMAPYFIIIAMICAVSYLRGMIV